MGITLLLGFVTRVVSGFIVVHPALVGMNSVLADETGPHSPNGRPLDGRGWRGADDLLVLIDHTNTWPG